MTVKMNYRKPFFEITVILLLILSSLIVYGQVRNFDFVHFDDTTYVPQNKDIQQGLTVDSVSWALTTVIMPMNERRMKKAFILL